MAAAVRPRRGDRGSGARVGALPVPGPRADRRFRRRGPGGVAGRSRPVRVDLPPLRTLPRDAPSRPRAGRPPPRAHPWRRRPLAGGATVRRPVRRRRTASDRRLQPGSGRVRHDRDRSRGRASLRPASPRCSSWSGTAPTGTTRRRSRCAAEHPDRDPDAGPNGSLRQAGAGRHTLQIHRAAVVRTSDAGAFSAARAVAAGGRQQPRLPGHLGRAVHITLFIHSGLDTTGGRGPPVVGPPHGRHRVTVVMRRGRAGRRR